MKYPKICYRIIFTLLVFTWGSSFAGNDEELERLLELDNKCKVAREAKLKPLQDEKIEECVSEQGKPRDYCEQYYEGYGWGSSSGRFRNQRFFDDIPECIAAFEAWENRKR